MKKLTEICVPLLFTLFLIPRAFAEGETTIIDFSGITTAINQMFSGLSTGLTEISTGVTALPNAIVNSFISFLTTEYINFLNPLLELARVFMTTNPDTSLMYSTWEMVAHLISLFYLVIFLGIGLLFVFSSLDAGKRLKAKEWFKQAIFLVVGVNASFAFYTLFLGLGAAMAEYLWLEEYASVFSNETLSLLNLVLLFVYGATVLLAFITLFIRYLILLLGTALIPLAVAFYFMPPLKAWGKMIIEILFACLLMQVVDVIIFIAASTVWKQFAGYPDILGWAPIMAFTLIAIVNTLILVFALLKALRTTAQQVPEVVAVGKAAGQAVIAGLL